MSEPIHHPPPDTMRAAARKPTGPLLESPPCPSAHGTSTQDALTLASPRSQKGMSGWRLGRVKGLLAPAHFIYAPAVIREGGLFCPRFTEAQGGEVTCAKSHSTTGA